MARSPTPTAPHRRWRFAFAAVAAAFGAVMFALWWLRPRVETSESAEPTRVSGRRGTPRPAGERIERPSASPAIAADERHPTADAPTPTGEEAWPAVLFEVVDTRHEPVDDAFVRLDCDAERGGARSGDVVRIAPGPCSATAFRRDGMLVTRSDEVSFEVLPDNDDQVVDLVLPAERTGGIGVQFHPTEDGMVVDVVRPNSPAEAAGLLPGDVITDVDGLSTAALTAEDFVSVMTGPEGSGITFAVSRDGSEDDVLTLSRAFIAPDS